MAFFSGHDLGKNLGFYEFSYHINVHLLIFREVEIHYVYLLFSINLFKLPSGNARSAVERLVMGAQLTLRVLKKSRRGRLGPIS